LYSKETAPLSKQIMSRSTIFGMSSDHTACPKPKRLVAATSEETTNDVSLWDVDAGKEFQKLASHSSPIRDIRHLGDATADILVCLSAELVSVYKLL
jgi:WD40 repeat protein